MKYANGFGTKTIIMSQNFKLTVCFYLMILANLCQAEETATYSVVAEESIENNIGDDIAAGNLIIDNKKGIDRFYFDVVEATESVMSADGEIVENLNHIVKNDAKSSTGGEHVIASKIANTAESVTEPTQESTNEMKSAFESAAVNDQIDCVCNCSANGSKVNLECSTQALDKIQTSPNSVNDNSDSNPLGSDTTNPLESDTTNPTNSKESLTSSNSNSQTADDTTTAAVINENPETSSESNPSNETSTTTSPTSCFTPGVKPHELDCKQYYDCSSEGFLDGSFHLLSKSCPDKQIFNSELNRCSRDISSCANAIECIVKGGVADSASNKSYYLCEPRLVGDGFHIFHVECSSNEIFYPELAKCFVDFNNLPSQIYPPYIWNQIKDIDIVKAEMKLLKEQAKLKLKQEKVNKKAEEKLQKQIEKEAKKRAKDEAKANKEKAKMVFANFVCAKEGNFESTVADDTYYACINKNGKLKGLVMQCPINSKFDAPTGTCLKNSPTDKNNDYDTDDDEHYD